MSQLVTTIGRSDGDWSLVQSPEVPFGSQQVAGYQQLTEEHLCERIKAAKVKCGPETIILGHHYQKDEIIQFADRRGDSLRLSQEAAAVKNVKNVVFCGVHFMAETADILTEPDVRVILPDMNAGCSMADMADIDQVEACWDELAEVIDVTQITPVTYINSTAALKSFCGQHEGVVCTSTNAKRVLTWAFERRPKVLFFPDQHLGRNTAKGMGIPLDQMIVWDPKKPLGGNSKEAVQNAKVILWLGWCSVHQVFKLDHVNLHRKMDPQVKILVHPECPMEVVDHADLVGSTEFIVKTVKKAPPGSRWAIGTELHLVNRLRQEHPEQSIAFLSPTVCMCATMYRIDLPHLCWTLESLASGRVVNQIKVDDKTRQFALKSLNQMLSLAEKGTAD